MCSIWAAVASKTAVYAFEAESQNFALLNRNTWINRLAGQVAALPLAIADTVGLDKLYLSEFIAGGSCHNQGEALDFREQPLVRRHINYET